MPLRLETERLLLPPLAERHTADLAAIYADPEVARYIGGDRLDAAGTATQVAHFEQVWAQHGFGQSALIDRTSGALLGRAGLHPWPVWGEVELGYVVARQVIHPDNRPSRALATRLGFHLHRHDTTPRGAPVVVYERLAPSTPAG